MIKVAMKGMAMGIAEVIPGVSGGTIALITGIYSKLIKNIKNFDHNLVLDIKKKGLTSINDHLDISFLIFLVGGMFLGIVVGVFGVSYLFEHYPEPLWGFFFGLIISSSIFVGKQIDNWKISNVAVLVVGAFIAYFITTLSPVSGEASTWYLLLSGILAISALILPGVSGSFILLLMGMYTVVIPAVKNVISDQDMASFKIVLVFGIGCIIGLLGFSRVMHYLFEKHRTTTLATLTGFMIGSLNKIWPWRNANEILIKDNLQVVDIHSSSDLSQLLPDAYKVLVESKVMPGEYFMSSPKTTMTIAAIIIGFLIVFSI